MTKPILLGNRIQVVLPGGQVFYWNGSGYSAEIERAVAHRGAFAAVEQIEACQSCLARRDPAELTVARADLVLVLMQISRRSAQPAAHLPGEPPAQRQRLEDGPAAGRPLQPAAAGKAKRLAV